MARVDTWGGQKKQFVVLLQNGHGPPRGSARELSRAATSLPTSVRADTPATFADTIIRLLIDKEEREKLSDGAPARTREILSNQEVADFLTRQASLKPA